MPMLHKTSIIRVSKSYLVRYDLIPRKRDRTITRLLRPPDNENTDKQAYIQVQNWILTHNPVPER
jgi:hypothetical protein